MREKINNHEVCSLDEWVNTHNSIDEKREVFVNMDRALKYIHDRGYCVYNFFKDNESTKTSIDVIDNNPRLVRFNDISELSSDPSKSEKIIQEDIFMCALIEICYYIGIPFNRINLKFLKENFSSFAQFLPEDDVPYYRGVIVRGSNVYYSEYINDRNNRNLSKLESEVGGQGKSLVKSSSHRIDMNAFNTSIYDKIYSKDMGMSDDAFINTLMVPTIVMFIILVISAVLWVFSLI